MDARNWIIFLLTLILIGVTALLWWNYQIARQADRFVGMFNNATEYARNAIIAGSKKSATDLLHEAIIRLDPDHKLRDVVEKVMHH